MSNSDSGNGCMGIIILFLLIAVIPMVLELIQALFGLAILFGCGYIIFWLFQYEEKHEIVARHLKKNIKSENETIDLSQQSNGTYGLAEPKENILDEIKKINDKLERVQRENEEWIRQRDTEIRKDLNRYVERIQHKTKKDILSGFFGEKENNYTRSDEYEKQQFQESVKKKKEELDIREMRHEVNEQLFEQDKRIFEYRDEAKEDRFQIRQEMQTGFLEINFKFLYLEKEFTTFKGFVSEKFSQMEINFERVIGQVREQLGDLKSELKTDIANVRNEFGREIMRLDKQQLKIISRMKDYEVQIRKFTFDMLQIKTEAERFAMRGEDMLNRANTVHERHKAAMLIASNEINTGLKLMAVHKDDFANKVGQAKLLMDTISQDQYFALKDMAYERVGIEILRKEHQDRAALEQEKLSRLVDQQRHLEEKIRTEQARGREVNDLRHRLYMTNENLQHTRNRASLMQQEFAVMKKLLR